MILSTVASMTLHNHPMGLLKHTYNRFETPQLDYYHSRKCNIESGVAGASAALAVGPALAVVLHRYISTMPVYSVYIKPKYIKLCPFHILVETIQRKFITTYTDNTVPHLIAGFHNIVHLEALLAVDQNNPNIERD